MTVYVSALCVCKCVHVHVYVIVPHHYGYVPEDSLSNHSVLLCIIVLLYVARPQMASTISNVRNGSSNWWLNLSNVFVAVQHCNTLMCMYVLSVAIIEHSLPRLPFSSSHSVLYMSQAPHFFPHRLFMDCIIVKYSNQLCYVLRSDCVVYII